MSEVSLDLPTEEMGKRNDRTITPMITPRVIDENGLKNRTYRATNIIIIIIAIYNVKTVENLFSIFLKIYKLKRDFFNLKREKMGEYLTFRNRVKSELILTQDEFISSVKQIYENNLSTQTLTEMDLYFACKDMSTPSLCRRFLSKTIIFHVLEAIGQNSMELNLENIPIDTLELWARQTENNSLDIAEICIGLSLNMEILSKETTIAQELSRFNLPSKMKSYISSDRFFSNSYFPRTFQDFTYRVALIAESVEEMATAQYIFREYIICYLEVRGYSWYCLDFDEYFSKEPSSIESSILPLLPSNLNWNEEFVKSTNLWDRAEKCIRNLSWNHLEILSLPNVDHLINTSDETIIEKINSCSNCAELVMASQVPEKTENQYKFWGYLLRDIGNHLIQISASKNSSTSTQTTDELETQVLTQSLIKLNEDRFKQKVKNLKLWVKKDPLFSIITICKCQNETGEINWDQLIEHAKDRSKGRREIKKYVRAIRKAHSSK